MTDMLSKAKFIEDYIISLRRELHEYPELSGQELETQKKLIRELESLGIPYKRAGNTSLIATIKGARPGKTVALRSDTDALPIIEQSGVDFASQNPGISHSCGHDGHMAMLLGAAKLLSQMKQELAGEIRLFFQEGEETFTGAKKIIEAGGMEGVDAILGMHGMPLMDTGYYELTPGYRMAGCDTIFVKFEGVSGHGSAPHLAKDTIHPASQFVLDLQAIATKNVDPQQPIVLSVGRFHGGTKANVISKFTELDISMRYFDSQIRETVHGAIIRHAKSIADAYEIKVDVKIEESAISLYNDDELTAFVQKSAIKVFGQGKNKTLPKMMGSEDMPYYFQHAKGVFALLGFGNKEKGSIYYPHHEKFRIDEDYLVYGTALHVQFALDYLNS